MKRRRKIVIVPDKFKGSLSAEEVISALESSVRERMVGGQDAEIVGIPLSDGGDGFLSQMASLEPQIASADVVITGEGCFDGQSLCGKLVSGVVEICGKYGKKPLVVCGSSKLSKDVWKKAGIEDVFSLAEIEGNMEKCISDASRLAGGRNVLVAGCDEAGRGCLAGPVFAAAVILPEDFDHPFLNDSKQLTEEKRNFLRPIIEREALAWAVASVDAQEIDRINILNASIKAMHLALDKLSKRPDIILVDGNRFKPYRDVPSHTVVKGDAKVKAVAAASVLAKTYKDEFLRKLAEEYPQYGWDHNAGYPTEEHREAIRKYGVSKYHRLSYNLLGNSGELF